MLFLCFLLLLVIIGLLMMFSASYPSGLAYADDSFFYLKKQSLFAIVGLGLMVGVSYFDYHHWHKLTYPVLVLSVLLLIAVLVIPSQSDVKRWIYIGSIGFQPSELVKFAVILAMADWGSRHFRQMGTFRYGVLYALILFAVVGGLTLMEPHYSGVAIILVLVLLMMFIGGVKWRWFILVFAAIGLLVMFLAVTGKLGYAMSRLHGWGQALIYTTDEMWQTTYQTRNSLYAIGSGGFWGLGLGMSRQKYLYIPEVQNDFVFAVVCEELGFIGVLVILILFGLLVWRGIMISLQSKDKFGRLLGVGLSAQVGLQVVLNLLVITDWMPNTGISLPFFSYGGTSLIMLLVQMGIVLSISRTATLEKA